MIVVTGAAGFIGSAIVWHLNQIGITDIIVSDKFRDGDKWKNLAKRDFLDFVDKDNLFDWLKENGSKVEVIIHMGACSATTEKDMDFLMENNYGYTKKLWEISLENHIRFIYASSAATYGDGENGYSDEHDTIKSLSPLNKYGYSKHIFDKWALRQDDAPMQWVGLKFFNVYGPNEYHKGKMASVVFHAYNQALENNGIKLFKSHKDGYKDGGQLRDFIYIKDVLKTIEFFINNKEVSGIFNIGTGSARSFEELGGNTLSAMGKERSITYVDMPIEIRDKYQYFTEASIGKIRTAGYKEKFYTLEEGIKDYVQNYLMKEDKYL